MTDDHTPSPRGGFAAAVIACCAIGALTIGATFLSGRDRPATEGTEFALEVATEEYGRRLVAETPALLGPDHPDPAQRYSGSRLACGSCHIDTGTEPGTLSLLQADEKYPRFSGRDGAMSDLKDRVNGCMQRSMNGRPLPRDSVEMIAIVAYIQSLRDQYAAMGASQRTPTEPAPFVAPDRAANLENGEQVFNNRCAICHGADGSGLLATPDPAGGYLFPPLWGPDSFNDGAGMNRVLTAGRFIKARMPFGQADLTDDEVFDVSAFINSKPRPAMANLERDYPDRTLKPVDSPYGPYADDFPIEQHRFGPFAPIEEFYKAQREANASTGSR